MTYRFLSYGTDRGPWRSCRETGRPTAPTYCPASPAVRSPRLCRRRYGDGGTRAVQLSGPHRTGPSTRDCPVQERREQPVRRRGRRHRVAVVNRSCRPRHHRCCRHRHPHCACCHPHAPLSGCPDPKPARPLSASVPLRSLSALLPPHPPSASVVLSPRATTGGADRGVPPVLLRRRQPTAPPGHSPAGPPVPRSSGAVWRCSCRDGGPGSRSSGPCGPSAGAATPRTARRRPRSTPLPQPPTCPRISGGPYTCTSDGLGWFHPRRAGVRRCAGPS